MPGHFSDDGRSARGGGFFADHPKLKIALIVVVALLVIGILGSIFGGGSGDDGDEQLIRVVEVRALTDGAVSDAMGCDVEPGQSAGWRRLPGGVAFSLGLSLDPEARIRCGLEVGRGLDAPYGQRDFATVDEMADWARGMAGDDVADALVRLAAII